MEVSSSSGRIEKFNGRPGMISLKEFKATFSTVVCELEFKYGVNYTEVFAFKQLARYVHYEALDVYEQHSARILGVTQIPNPTYAITIATAFQAALQITIAHHGIVPIHQLLLIQQGNSFVFLSWNFQSKVLKNSVVCHLLSVEG